MDLSRGAVDVRAGDAAVVVVNTVVDLVYPLIREPQGACPNDRFHFCALPARTRGPPDAWPVLTVADPGCCMGVLSLICSSRGASPLIPALTTDGRRLPCPSTLTGISSDHWLGRPTRAHDTFSQLLAGCRTA